MIAKDEDEKCVAFVHFRFDIDQDLEVLFVYEVQLEKEVRRQGERCERSITVSDGLLRSAIIRVALYQIPLSSVVTRVTYVTGVNFQQVWVDL